MTQQNNSKLQVSTWTRFNTLVKALSKDFKGDWKLISVWEESKIQVCQGHPLMAEMANELVIRKRGEYTLSDRLKNYPLPHNLVILDCPATLGMLNVNALAASTHILVPVQLEMKAISGSAELVRKIRIKYLIPI
ncbi:ParA family protein [Nostoc sp.]|uniref:ParA family protein n=1 Tax=Nostoc sp. TaxID=1180 RepID=UPI002FFC7964